MFNEDVSLTNFVSYVHLKTWFGLEVIYTADMWRVEVMVPACYAQLTEGLCGNFDNSQIEEFGEYSKAEVVTWAHKWLIPDATDPECVAGPLEFEPCEDENVKDA